CAADIHRAATSAQRVDAVHHLLRRRAGADTVDHRVDALAAIARAGPGGDVACAERQGFNPPLAERLDPLQSPGIARRAEDTRDAAAQCDQCGAEAERAGDAVD